MLQKKWNHIYKQFYKYDLIYKAVLQWYTYLHFISGAS